MEDIYVVGKKNWLEMALKWTFRPVANFGDQSLLSKHIFGVFLAHLLCNHEFITDVKVDLIDFFFFMIIFTTCSLVAHHFLFVY